MKACGIQQAETINPTNRKHKMGYYVFVTLMTVKVNMSLKILDNLTI